MAVAQNLSRPQLQDIPGALWAAMGMVAVALAIVLHAVFPRFEYQIVDDGHGMVIYDRWTNRFQRTNYDANGAPTLTPVVTPF